MPIKIKSGDVEVLCLQQCAMLHSLKKNGTEYLWQGNPDVWAGQAPVCFPIVGVLKDGKAIAFGKETQMKRHGVARISPFEIKEQGANYVTFVQNSSDEIKKAFPFDYRLEIKYTVVGSTVTTEYTVFNTGTEKLPFTIGGHPAFNCPLAEGEAFEDYKVKFDRVMTHKCLRPAVVSCLVDTSKRFNVLENTDEIAMRHELFDLDAMVFDGIESKSATLIGKSGRGVRLDYQDFENLLIWSSSNGGKFVALEPWTGISTCLDENEIFEDKRGMTVLEPNEQASFKFKITLI
jgi:galactose mutarotase-like enzyme